MRYATLHLSIVLSLALAGLTADAVTSGEEPWSKIKDGTQARTDIYGRFDPEQYGRKYLSHFERNAEFSVKLSSLPGRHISFRHGQARGDMDEHLDGEDGDLSWCMLCSVHEPGEPRSDQARILGTWRVIGSIGGEEVPKEALGSEVEFTADFMILKPKNANGPGDWVKLRYELDPAHDPRHIDTRNRLSSEENSIVQLGIYSLENGELRFVLASAGQPRPTDFRSIPQAFVLECVDET